MKKQYICIVLKNEFVGIIPIKKDCLCFLDSFHLNHFESYNFNLLSTTDEILNILNT